MTITLNHEIVGLASETDHIGRVDVPAGNYKMKQMPGGHQAILIGAPQGEVHAFLVDQDDNDFIGATSSQSLWE